MSETSNNINFSVKKSTSIYDIPYFVTDNKKVKKIYKWKPIKSMDDIVRDIYLWMQNNSRKLKIYFK